MSDCVRVPEEWIGSSDYYADGEDCDCGRGALDPDCGTDPTIDACDWCWCESGGSLHRTGCPARVLPDDITTCRPIPEEWSCREEYYSSQDGCDCGCGALDPDCGDAPTLESCTWCGNCGGDTCPGTVDPAQLGVCTSE